MERMNYSDSNTWSEEREIKVGHPAIQIHWQGQENVDEECGPVPHKGNILPPLLQVVGEDIQTTRGHPFGLRATGSVARAIMGFILEELM